MKTGPDELATIQRWMLSVISDPAGVEAGLQSPTAVDEVPLAASDLEQVILPSTACSSQERLEVYNRAYFARLIECLQDEFPALRHAVGDDTFAAFAIGYVQSIPPSSHSLSDLGRRLPSYLNETRPSRDGETPDWADFLIDLATLERHYSEVFDGPGEEGQPQFSTVTLQGVPAEAWGTLRLATSASLRLLKLRFPVHEYITAVRHEGMPSFPEPCPIWLAVHRRDFVVRRQSLNETQFELLRALHEGSPLGDAIGQAAAVWAGELPTLAEEFQQWFRNWGAGGYFTAILDAPPHVA